MFRAADLEAKLPVRRHCPEKWWPGREAELMARMVLGKAAISLCVRSAPGTGAQIRSQFLQLDRAASHFHPDENLAGPQSQEQIKLDPRSVMLRFSRFEGDMVPEPATLEHQARGGRELADIFPEN